MINWWLYDSEDVKPKLNHTPNTQKFVTNSNLYLQTVNAAKTIIYDIPKGIIPENKSREKFNSAIKIIEIPDSTKDEYYFYSDNYDATWWVFISHADWGLLKSKARLQKELARLQKELARLQRLQKKLKEQDKEIEELKKKIRGLK